ncbi:MAG: hypothetical protein AVDCRST_MAG89-3027, partial [uncultured Gemmatimonadetes bacterium]
DRTDRTHPARLRQGGRGRGGRAHPGAARGVHHHAAPRGTRARRGADGPGRHSLRRAAGHQRREAALAAGPRADRRHPRAVRRPDERRADGQGGAQHRRRAGHGRAPAPLPAPHRGRARVRLPRGGRAAAM